MEDPYQDRSLPEEVPTSSSGSNRTNDSDDVESHNPAETDYYALLNVSHTVKSSVVVLVISAVDISGDRHSQSY